MFLCSGLLALCNSTGSQGSSRRLRITGREHLSRTISSCWHYHSCSSILLQHLYFYCTNILWSILLAGCWCSWVIEACSIVTDLISLGVWLIYNRGSQTIPVLYSDQPSPVVQNATREVCSKGLQGQRKVHVEMTPRMITTEEPMA